MDYPLMVNPPWESTYHMDPNFYGSSFFEQSYRCFQFKHSQHSHLQSSDKIILLESALLRLLHMDIQYPMLFQLQSPETGRVSYCGVVEFSSKEGEVLLPNWIMEKMGVEQGDVIMIKNVNLVKGSYIKMQPHTTEFIHLFDPKSVLESALIRGFTCFSAGDTIMIMHEGKKFYIDVLETKPATTISVSDTDCEVDFAPPWDNEEPEKAKPADKIIEKASREVGKKEKQVVVADDEERKFRPFMGVAKWLDGSPVLASFSTSKEGKQTSVVGWKDGKLVFGSSDAVGKPLEESKKADDQRRIMEKKKEEKGWFSGIHWENLQVGYKMKYLSNSLR